MQVNIDNKSIAVDTSHIEDMEDYKLSYSEVDSLANEAFKEALRSEGIKLDLNNEEHKKAFNEVCFYITIRITAKRAENKKEVI